jgi:chemotaxis protein MotB
MGTFSDMVTLLLTFFILLFALSTLQIMKFEAQIGALKGSLGISKLYAHAPMQQTLPAPSVKESPRKIAKSTVKPTTLQPLAEYVRVDLTEPVQKEESDAVRTVMQSLGDDGDFNISYEEEDVILTLPSYGLFNKGQYKISPDAPEVQRVLKKYNDLAKNVAKLIDYDVNFVGHTDALSIAGTIYGDNLDAPKNNMELGFLRAVAVYEFFFQTYLTDKTRITFSSKGDNVPLIADAKLDSEMRKNRRVEIYLRKKKVRVDA